MWLLFAILSAVFAGLTAVLAKVGIQDTDSTLATALRTVVVVVFAWGMVLLVGSGGGIAALDGRTLLFLCLSGLATGASWLCYFKALQTGDINKVVPIDKSSTVLTMLLAFLFLGEGITPLKGLCMAAILLGTLLMVERKSGVATATGRGWLVYAVLAAVFASLTALLGKVGIQGVESNLGTAIRTLVVLVMAWLMVFLQKKQRGIQHISKRSWLFLGLSGFATGASWLCYYRALQDGPVSVVVPVDKLSILITAAFGVLVFRERLTAKSGLGLGLVTAATVALVFL